MPIEIGIKPGETSPISTLVKAPWPGLSGREAGDRNYEKLLFTFGLNYSRNKPKNGPRCRQAYLRIPWAREADYGTKVSAGPAETQQGGPGWPRPGRVDFPLSAKCAQVVKDCADRGVQVGLVVGGGNYWRGVKDGGGQMERSRADQMGMLATVMNSLALQDVLEQVGQPARVLTSIPMGRWGDPLPPRCGPVPPGGEVSDLCRGTGNLFFPPTRPPSSGQRKSNGYDPLAKNIDSVYSADPKKDPGAVKYDAISYDQVLADHLQVMDLTATSLAMENHIPVMIFALADPQNILRAVMGERIGTIVEEETKS